jgi:PAS domain S-box-containing protein
MMDEFNILLVEDNCNDVALVKQELLKDPHNSLRLVHVGSLGGAMRALERQHFDLVLLDLHLTDSSGISTFASIQSVISNSTGVIILSGAEDDELAAKAVASGAIDYLVKQVDTRPIAYAVGRWRLETVTTVQARHQLTIASLGQQALVGIPIENLFSEVVALYAVSLGVEMAAIIEGTSGTPQRVRAAHGVATSREYRQIRHGDVEEAGARALVWRVDAEEPIPQSIPFSHLPQPLFGIEAEIRTKEGVWGVLLALTGKQRQFRQQERLFAHSVAHLVGQALWRKAAEDAVFQSEARFRATFEQAAVGIAHVAPDGRFLRVNRKLCEILGFSRDELLIKTFADISVPEDRNAGEKSRIALLTGQLSSLVVEKRFLRRDGQAVWVALVSALQRSNSGAPEYLISVFQDIQERKAAEERSRRNEAMLTSAVRIAQLGSWEYDVVQDSLSWSNETFRIFGLTPSEFHGRFENFLQHVHPADRSLVIKNRDKTVEQGGSIEQEFRIVRPDGQERFVSSRGETVFNEAGRAVRKLGVIMDITERKRAEAHLKESEERFRQLAENINEVFWLVDVKNQTVTYVSPAYERIWGRAREALYRDPNEWIEVLHKEDKERVDASFTAKIRSGGGYKEVYRIVRQEGDVRWIRDRAFSIRDESGIVYRIAGTAEDITDYKLAEERLVEQAALLDLAYDAIMVKDLDDVIQYWNRGAERVFGWTAEEAVSQKCTSLFGLDLQSYSHALETLLSRGEWIGEMVKRTKSRREILVEARWTLIRWPNGRPKSVLSLNTDITDKRRLEEQFLRAQRMESIGTLAGGIAHDLNNILSPILLSIEVLKKEITSPKGRSFLTTLERCALRGADLVKQVLSFARGLEGRKVPVNVLSLALEIEKIVRETFPKNIVFSLKSESAPWNVVGDITQLHQLLMNLCVNARDAMPAGGQLTVEFKNTVVDQLYAGLNGTLSPGRYLLLTVSDTGTGMKPETQQRIFDPFFTTKEPGQGTGLGLSTVLTIVKGHGGFINVYSELGKGTKFHVYLPANNALVGAENTVITNTGIPRGNGELILVIEDEEAIRMVTKRTLEQFGYRVLTAANGAEAISRYVQMHEAIAVVLTDMAMPIMDGPATIVALKSINPQVKIVGSSGLSSDALVDKAISSGVRHFVPKPYTAESLLSLLHKLCSEGKASTTKAESSDAPRSIT